MIFKYCFNDAEDSWRGHEVKENIYIESGMQIGPEVRLKLYCNPFSKLFKSLWLLSSTAMHGLFNAKFLKYQRDLLIK